MTFAARELREHREHDIRVWRAGEGPAIVGLAGPPTSALLFRHLARPIADAGRSLVLPELFDPAPARADVGALADRVAPFVAPDTILLAHGLALPVALEVARRRRVAGVALLDGPLERLDPVAAAMARWSANVPSLARQLLRPSLIVPLLSSSAALRRAVVNPYVMDRDIVVLLSAPLIATPDRRAAVVQYLASLAEIERPWPNPGAPVLLVWSASNLLYPLPADPAGLLSGADVTAVSMPGARFFDVEERPWEVADALIGWIRERIAPATVTRMS